jgi:beta-lactamase superfamily II metal-dependent hydrolase
MKPHAAVASRLVHRQRRAFALAALLALALLPTAARAITGNGKLQIHHIDVGQGDGALLISPNGQTALFDDGNYLNCTNIKNYLQGLGITSVDYHFCSHYHSDHLGCLDDLAAIGITIGTAAYDRGYSYSSGTYTTYVSTVGTKRTTMTKGQTVTLDAGSANPVVIKCVDVNGAGVYSVSGSDENAKSLALLVSYGSFQEEISGDLTGDATAGTDIETVVGPEVGAVEVYKAHHHGSRYSNNDNWLAAVTPQVCVISCGDGNSYGHPTTDALNRMHAHSVHTYWTETGAGATPDANWDKVAHGTVVIQADPGVGAAFTITGPGIADTYFNTDGPGGGGGGGTPAHATEFPTALTVLHGSLNTGTVDRLQVSDNSRVSIGATATSSQYWTDWYASDFLAHTPTNLTVTYEGSFTVSRTQTLHVWNWLTSAWEQVNSATVSTTDVTKTWTTSSPAAYVGPANEVRFRILGNNRTSTYTSRGDFMKFEYDYTTGALPAFVASASPELLQSVHVHPGADPERAAPQGMLRRVEAVSSAAGATLTWAVGVNEDADGFNVYREAADGSLVFVGNEPELQLAGDEARFRFLDPGAADAACTGTYWLGVRSCAAPEGLIGPIEVGGAVASQRIALAASPNPARSLARLQFAVERAGEFRLDLLDVQGRVVATPFVGHAEPGVRAAEWNLQLAGGHRAPQGVYFARLTGGGRTQVVRVTVTGN